MRASEREADFLLYAVTGSYQTESGNVIIITVWIIQSRSWWAEKWEGSCRCSLSSPPPRASLFSAWKPLLRSLGPNSFIYSKRKILQTFLSWICPSWMAFKDPSIKDLFDCRHRYFCTCFLLHLCKVFCCSGIDLHFSCQSMFASKRQKESRQIPEIISKEKLSKRYIWLHIANMLNDLIWTRC